MKKHFFAVFAFLGALTLSLTAAEAPVMRIGLFSDTHWKANDPASFKHTEIALNVFKREKVDGIWHLGDIADLHYPDAYRYYRQTLFPKVFPENPPSELFVYANHDALRRDARGGAERLSPDEMFAAVRRELGVPNAPDDRRVIRGYPVLIFQQFAKRETKEKALAEIVREFPGKPVFVLDHEPASRLPGGKTRGPYGKYPQVIHIYGHVHSPLRDENSIWQGTHTEVSAGCLYNWRGSLVGSVPPTKLATDFAVMDVYPEKIVYRRFTVETGREGAEPWIIPLPFDPKTAPYRVDFRKANTPAPAFAPGTSLSLTPDRPFAALKIGWPAASGEVYKYFVTIERKGADGKFRPIARTDCHSEFYLDRSRRTGKFELAVSAGYFDPGQTYRIAVAPAGFFGQKGAPVAAGFTPPAERLRTEVLFESRDPMKEMKAGLNRGKRPGESKPLAVKDGFYQYRGGYARLFIPAEAWAKLAGGKRFRFTVDMDSRQNYPAWTMVLNNPDPFRNANNRLKMPEGENLNYRYVIENTPRGDRDVYSLLLREGGPGEFRFNYVKLEKLP